ncbi:MAG: hypothetical protein HKP30_00055 [Myxococcales bacterium]|nr:hypothetical protein [Myxococcales bacterium]
MARPPRPTRDRDSAFFWEGLEADELRVQRCMACNALRHPPGPLCPGCHSFDWDWIVSCGRGEVYSFVVHHHPPIPGLDVPCVIALVEIEEGTRLVANVTGIAPEDVTVGLPVEIEFQHIPGDDGWTLPRWRPRGSAA